MRTWDVVKRSKTSLGTSQTKLMSEGSISSRRKPKRVVNVLLPRRYSTVLQLVKRIPAHVHLNSSLGDGLRRCAFAFGPAECFRRPHCNCNDVACVPRPIIQKMAQDVLESLSTLEKRILSLHNKSSTHLPDLKSTNPISSRCETHARARGPEGRAPAPPPPPRKSPSPIFCPLGMIYLFRVNSI